MLKNCKKCSICKCKRCKCKCKCNICKCKCIDLSGLADSGAPAMGLMGAMGELYLDIDDCRLYEFDGANYSDPVKSLEMAIKSDYWTYRLPHCKVHFTFNGNESVKSMSPARCAEQSISSNLLA